MSKANYHTPDSESDGSTLDDFLCSEPEYLYVSTQQYLKLVQAGSDKILEATFIPPKLGSGHFGKFKLKINHDDHP